MLGLFKKKQKEEVVVAPLTGKVIPLSEVPDPVFAQKNDGRWSRDYSNRGCLSITS
ncbi:phosphoenolpyruvate-dependent sugar phosphotransferase system, EIIA 1 [Alkalibacterium thalassium]|uniref:Phosphoenolpyruvate-dependent sugar phosphotransferase system, EIIA 1 n=1 Tax=Alkalibacterium thalassium TaxID=426701 RepID=A0A1G9FRW9_9LACT|nr:phosphoenolpyruvate-dependent sugar phosphotransferase system, EIIA 1 [Alkalibacterium thalassium]